MKLILNVHCLKLIHVLARTPVIDSRPSRKMVASINHKISTKKDCRKVLLSEFKFCPFVRISMQSELVLILVLSKNFRILILSENLLCCQKFDDIIMFMLSEFVRIL